MSKNQASIETGYYITPCEAKARIHNWQQSQAKIREALKNTPGHIYEGAPMLHVKAFTFKYDELHDLIEKISGYNSESRDHKVNAVRFYLGVKTHDHEAVPPTPCLVTVGVSEFQPDESMGGDDVLSLPTINPSGPSLVCDFSYPCPTTCANEGHSIMDEQCD